MKRRRRKTSPVSYGGLQAAYVKNCGLVVESYQMVDQTDVFFPWDDLLREYVKKNRMVEASRILSWHVLILAYIKVGRMSDAKKIFNSSPKTGTVWESMICGFARHGKYKLARRMFKRRPGETMLTRQMLIAGHLIGNLEHDTQHFCFSMNIENNRFGYTEKEFEEKKEECEIATDHKHTATWNLLIEGNLFAGLYDGARDVFEDMITANKMNAMSWNLMMAGRHRLAFSNGVLPKMPTQFQNSHTWNLMMAARGRCFDQEKDDENFEEAVSIFHLHMPENQRNTASWNAMISILVDRGKLDQARFYFDNMAPEIRNPHSWGLMMAGYLEADMFDEAKNIFLDKNIRVCNDLHSWVLILGWFVRRKKMIDEARRFLVTNVPKRPLSFYSIASACIKHGFREESNLVLESMQATMHTNLNIHQTITFLEEKLKENRGPSLFVHVWMDYTESCIQEYEAAKNFSDPYYQYHVRRVKEESGPMFEYEPHSQSHTFLQILDSEIDANGDCSQILLKGSCDCCGLLQI